MNRVYLRSPSWTAIYLPGLGFQMLSVLYKNLPELALRWIGKLRAQVKKRPLRDALPDNVRARGVFRRYDSFEGLEVDLSNAFLCAARSRGIVTYRMWNEAIQIRKRYDIKPAMLLGMGLGGWIVKEVYNNGVRIRRDYLKPPSNEFKALAYITYQITRDVAYETGALAYNVDAILFPYTQRIDDLVMRVRSLYAAKFGLSDWYISLKVTHKKVSFFHRGLGFEYVLQDALSGERKSWITCAHTI
ncbi:MAG: hypothetical protein N3E49_09505 [Bacteroidia bacterium]|nr:hypothetical protein [Bacteroidia bacterium]